MGFTKALFYPTIDIDNDAWLKNAVLFWDEIHTIVPSTVDNPYKKDSTRFLYENEFLKPINVDSNDLLIKELAIDTINYLNTFEGRQVLTLNQDRSQLHRDKLPENVTRLFRMHPEKLAYELQYEFRDNLFSDGWLNVDSNFATFYMTLLANKIAEKNSIALLSDNSLTYNLSSLAKLDNPELMDKSRHSFHRHSHHEKYTNVSQGLLTNLIIEGIKISETTSLKDIIKFKRDNRDELGLFRSNIAKLTKDVSKDLPINAVKQQVEDIYNDDFLPSYNNFKKSLSGAGIRWTAENFMKITFFSAPTTSVPLAVMGLSTPQAILSGAAVSLLTSLVSYNLDKKEKLRNNPYSYLLAAENISKKK